MCESNAAVVVIYLAAANRDPAVFPDPQTALTSNAPMPTTSCVLYQPPLLPGGRLGPAPKARSGRERSSTASPMAAGAGKSA